MWGWELRQDFGFLLSAQHLKLCDLVLFDQNGKCCSNITSAAIAIIENQTKRSAAKSKASVFVAVHLTWITISPRIVCICTSTFVLVVLKDILCRLNRKKKDWF